MNWIKRLMHGTEGTEGTDGTDAGRGLRGWLAALAAAVALVAGPGQAQQFQLLSTIAGGSTYNIAGSTASNFAAAVTCTKWAEFDLEISFKMVAAGLSNIDLAWSTSDNGTTYATTKNQNAAGWFTAAVGNGTTTVLWRTNVTMNSAGYWRLDWLTNGDIVALTNLTIKAYAKPKRQG